MVSKISNNQEPLILAIETATRGGGVALTRGRELLWSAAGDSAVSHSTNLLATLKEGLQSIETALSEVDLFAAARGPGSFTGLRIGLATIKSFAACNGRRCAGISTLAAIAHAAGESVQTVSLLPAGRGELFAQSFLVRDGQVRELDSAAHLAPGTVLERYRGHADLVWAGEGAHLHAVALRDCAISQDLTFAEPGAGGTGPGQTGWRLAPTVDRLAVSIAALALDAYRGGDTVSPEDLQAVYVRASDAEINQQWQQAK